MYIIKVRLSSGISTPAVAAASITKDKLPPSSKLYNYIIMQKMIFLLAVYFTFSAAVAQHTIIKDPNAVLRKVDDFHAIHVSTGISLYLTQGGEKTVAVSAAQPEYRDRIRTEVKGGVLHIYYDTEKWKWLDFHGRELMVYVSCVDLDGLNACSGAKMQVNRTFKAANLAMDCASGAKF